MPSSNGGISIDNAGITKHCISYNVFFFFQMKYATTNVTVRLYHAAACVRMCDLE